MLANCLNDTMMIGMYRLNNRLLSIGRWKVHQESFNESLHFIMIAIAMIRSKNEHIRTSNTLLRGREVEVGR